MILIKHILILRLNNEDNQLIPRYFFLVQTVEPLYFLKRSTYTPPFLKISSSQLLQRSLLSLVSMQLSNWTKSPETWSSLYKSVLIGKFTILEQSFNISLSSLQLVGIAFFEFFLSVFFQAASSEGALGLFLSSFFSYFLSYLGSVKEILNSLSSNVRQPQTPSLSIQATIFFISGQPILERQSAYLDLRLSKVLFNFFLAITYSKLFEVTVLQDESSSKSSRSYWSLQLCFLPVIQTVDFEARAFCKKSRQVISAVFLMRTGSCSIKVVFFFAMYQDRELTIWVRDLARFSNSMFSDINLYFIKFWRRFCFKFITQFDWLIPNQKN